MLLNVSIRHSLPVIFPFFLLIGSGIAPSLTLAQTRVVKEERIATLKPTTSGAMEDGNYVMSADLKHVAFHADVGSASVTAERSAFASELARTVNGNAALGRGMSRDVARTFVTDKQVVIVDGVQLGPYGSVKQMAFSSDGSRFAFQARDEAGEFVVLDGKRLADGYRASSSPVFSPDGRRFAFVGHDFDPANKQRARSRAVLDGVAQAACDQLGENSDRENPLFFSANGQEFAWIGIRQSQFFVGVNGKEFGPFSTVIGSRVALSPDGKRFAFGVTRKTNETGRAATFLVVDGVETPLKDRLEAHSLVFSPNGRRLGYVTLAGGSHRVIVDGKSSKQWVGSGAPQIVFSPDSEHYAYIGKENGKTRVVADGKEEKSFVSVKGLPTFSPDSRHLAYAAEVRDETNRVSFYVAVVDGVRQELRLAPQNEASNIVFSQNGSHYAYFSKAKEGTCLVVDGKPGPRFAGSPKEHSLALSSDGTRTAWVLDTAPRPGQMPGERRLVLNGVLQKAYPEIEPRSVRFSPDGRHCAYVATGAARRGEFVVVNESEGKGYLALLPRFSAKPRVNLIGFDGNDRVRYFARTATDIVSVEETLR